MPCKFGILALVAAFIERFVMLLTLSSLGRFSVVLALISILTTLFLSIPLILIVALSFDSSPWLAFPPPSWTLKWYRELFSDGDWMSSFLISLQIGITVTIFSVMLGLVTSFGLTRGSFRGREVLRAFFLTPMVLPVVIVAVALYAFFLRLHLNGTFVGFVIAHLILALPFSIIAITNALELTDPAIEDAAVLCGASRFSARIRVTLPAIRLGLLSAAVFSFLASWDEVVVAIFMASPSLQTIPVRVWANLQQDLSPVIASVSSVLVALTLGLMLLLEFLRKKVN